MQKSAVLQKYNYAGNTEKCTSLKNAHNNLLFKYLLYKFILKYVQRSSYFGKKIFLKLFHMSSFSKCTVFLSQEYYF